MNRVVKYFEKELQENGLYEEVRSLNRYVGDVHNHCGISYGYGTIEHAVAFARTQLDFFSVTGHFAWPDIAEDDSMKIPPEVVAYHREGFAKLRRNWPHYKECMRLAQTSGFLPFSSYEYHSFHYGDYTILCKDLAEELPAEVPEGRRDTRLQRLLEGDAEQTDRFLCIPHHIGYKTGYRGINFDEYNGKVSPLIEIISMHGCAESSEAKIRYLHTMGPRCSDNTYQGGLKRGYHFGVTGSTDHHNAAPGSYGFGRTVLWSEELTRDSIWNSLRERRTSAASGDPIEAMLFVNGAFQGQRTALRETNTVAAYVAGFDKLDKVELIQGDRILAGRYVFNCSPSYSGCVGIMFGWGKKHIDTTWDVTVRILDGELICASPRFRGIDMVDPLDIPQDAGKFLPVFEVENNQVKLHLVTNGNLNAVTNSTQGFAMDIEGNENTRIELLLRAQWGDEVIEKRLTYSIDELRDRNTSEYVNGFVSPAIEIGPFSSLSETVCKFEEEFRLEDDQAIYLRAYQKNGDCVFTSPVSFVQ
jgi:hypothetical protein